MPADPESIRSCPRCGADHAIPIIYGLPSREGVERVQRGERVLGGCMVSVDSPRWQCRACGHRFGDHEDALRRLVPNAPRPRISH